MTKVAELEALFNQFHEKEEALRQSDNPRLKVFFKAITEITATFLNWAKKIEQMQPTTNRPHYEVGATVGGKKKTGEEAIFQDSINGEKKPEEPIPLSPTKTYPQQYDLGLQNNSYKLKTSSIQGMKKRVAERYAKIQGIHVKEQGRVARVCMEGPTLFGHIWNEGTSKGNPYKQIRRGPINVIAENYPDEWGIHTLRTRCVFGDGVMIRTVIHDLDDIPTTNQEEPISREIIVSLRLINYDG